MFVCLFGVGGAEMHSKVSGLSDYLAQDEYHAIKLAREIVFNLNMKQATPYPEQHLSRSFQEPIYDIGIFSSFLIILNNYLFCFLSGFF
jgi:acetyl-CoA carboxylase carboxyltransferase component